MVSLQQYMHKSNPPTHHFVDVLLDQLHSPGLCDHPPGLLRVEPHIHGHIVPDGEGEIVKYSGTSKQDI